MSCSIVRLGVLEIGVPYKEESGDSKEVLGTIVARLEST